MVSSDLLSDQPIIALVTLPWHCTQCKTLGDWSASAAWLEYGSDKLRTEARHGQFGTRMRVSLGRNDRFPTTPPPCGV
jgi:hypothetical protein